MTTSGQDTSLNVAVVQHPPVFLNIEESMERAITLVEEAANRGAKIIVFPETWLPGYPVWLDLSPKAALWDYRPANVLYRLLSENAIVVPGRHLTTLLALARRTGTYIVMGAHERLHGTLYNTMIFVDREGKDYCIHRKLVPTYGERLVWGRGDGSTLSTLDTDYGNLGGLICWEHWMPLTRAAMHAKRETIHVAQWPAAKDLHQLASRHYAFEGQCFVIVAGCVLARGDLIAGYHSLDNRAGEALEILEAIPGADQDLVLTGGSAIIAPTAEYIQEPVYGTAATIQADVQLGRITEGHLLLDVDGHYARPDLFQLQVDERPQSNVTFSA